MTTKKKVLKNLNNKKKNISDMVLEETTNTAQLNDINLKNIPVQKSSIWYVLELYEIMHYLKIRKRLGVKGIHEFVNVAIKEKLERDFPAECEKFLG